MMILFFQAINILLSLGQATTHPLPAVDSEAMHPFYVSVAEVEQNKQAQNLEVSLKFFTDDFEQAVNKESKTSFDLVQHKPNFDKLIDAYVQKRFSLQADGKKLALTYVGYEIEKESVYCYFEVPGVSAVKVLNVENTLLHNLTREQINIIHATIDGQRKSAKLNFPDSKTSFQFSK